MLLGIGVPADNTLYVASENRPFLFMAASLGFLLSVEYIALGPRSAMYGYGAGLETIPVHLGLLQSGSVHTLWAPFVAGGLDRLSFWGNADPLNLEPLLFAALPTWLAYGLHVLLQRFVSIYFTMRVTREQVGLDRNWSVLAGLLTGCFTYPADVGYMFTIVGAPLLLWVLPRLFRLRHALLLAPLAGAAFAPLTSFTFGGPYLAVFVVAWFAVVLRERSPRIYTATALFFGGLALVDSPQMLAVLYNVPFSQRAGWPTEEIGLSIDGLFYYQVYYDLFNQDQLLKVIVLWTPPLIIGLALPIAWTQRKARFECAIFLRIALVYATLSLKIVMILVQQVVGLVLPWIKGLYMGRFYQIPAPFLIPVLLALSLSILYPWLRQQALPERFKLSLWPRYLAVGMLSASIVFLAFWPKVSLFYPLLVDGWGEKNFQVKAIEELKARDRGVFRVASVLPLQPAYAYAQGLEAADGWANLYPAVYRDLWLRVLAPILAASPQTRAVLDPPGGKPQDNYIFLGLGLPAPDEDTATPLREGSDLERQFNLPLLSLLDVKYLLSEYPVRGPRLRLAAAPTVPPTPMRTRDYATGLYHAPQRTGAHDPSMFRFPRAAADFAEALTRKTRGKEIYVYENTEWFPRYRFITMLHHEPDGTRVLDRLSAMSAQSLRDQAVIEAPTPSDVEAPAGQWSPGRVDVIRYSPDEITLTIDNPGRGFLVIGNTWNPFWRAEVDGLPRRLLRVNHAQFGLVLGGGEQRVKLFYAPPYALHQVMARLIARMVGT